MTRKQTMIRIQNELQNQIGSLRKVTPIGHYKFASDHHYEFMLKDDERSVTLITISECEDGEIKLWNINNFATSFGSWLMLDIARTIHELNKKDAE